MAAKTCHLEYIDGGAYKVCSVHGEDMVRECAHFDPTDPAHVEAVEEADPDA